MEDEQPPTPATEEKPTAPQVNDITAPLPPPVGAKFEEAPTDSPSPRPAAPSAPTNNDVQPAPAKEEGDKSEKEDNKAEEPKPAEPPKVKAPKKHGSGFAIFAAIIIVIALGAMFTYAYLQTK